MKCTMFWHGGTSYNCFDTHDPQHAEVFDSVTAARDSFASRCHDPYYPCTSDAEPEHGGPEAWLFFGDEHPVLGGEYPDLIMRFNKFGTVVVEEG